MVAIIGQRILELYADLDGFSDKDRATIQREFKLTPQKAKAAAKAVRDSVVTSEEARGLVRLGFNRADFDTISGSNTNAAWKARMRWFEDYKPSECTRHQRCNFQNGIYAMFGNNGELLEIELPEELTYEGVSLKAGTAVGFEMNGSLRAGTLSKGKKFEGTKLKAGTHIRLENGILSEAHLSRNTVIGGNLYWAGTKLSFWENGKVSGVKLFRGATIDGIPVMSTGRRINSLVSVSFHTNGRMHFAFLAQDTIIQGHRIRAGEMVSFDERGKLEEVDNSNRRLVREDSVIDGIPVMGGTYMFCNPCDGDVELSAATLSRRKTIGGITLPRGTQVDLLGDDTVQFIRLRRKTKIRGINIRAGSFVSFYNDGRIIEIRSILTRDEVIGGNYFRKGTAITFDGSGNITSVMLFGNDTIIAGIPVSGKIEIGGETHESVDLYDTGVPRMATLSRDAKIKGANYKAGAFIEFNPDGAVK